MAVDGLGETTAWRLTTTLGLGGEVLPEQSVVDMAACRSASVSIVVCVHCKLSSLSLAGKWLTSVKFVVISADSLRVMAC